MPSHLLWFRLRSGRVWHVAASGSPVALCGQSIPARGERQPKRPPFGARPCPDCDAVMGEAERAMSAALVAFLPKGDIPAKGIHADVTCPCGHLPESHCAEEDAICLSGGGCHAAGCPCRRTQAEVSYARPLTDPEDDGDLPDLLGQDGEVTVR